ncbi:hypothetical protein JDV02_010841 [Purpureocillium takamizusanense]|uniref:Uncharacterized protein n=1 Tax=Purpureocillium takamizusanense TaxID=2060973 RepID=A0A9Q8VGM3_9HYPO|nr:uncharacterized protein JDV02_010841 [Purpureocillium takamizusanense]UNI24726.1 hypothetical protein JDV02_010841 [Purpureocillium takamizusanense]
MSCALARSPRCSLSSCHANAILLTPPIISPSPLPGLDWLHDMQLDADNQPRSVSKTMLPSNAADITRLPSRASLTPSLNVAVHVAFGNTWCEEREGGPGTNTENKTQQKKISHVVLFSLFGRRRRPANSKVCFRPLHHSKALVAVAS